ncbi:hypothetical protein L6452_33160 [Arctium lappa]|uniref:Uncharacterized protein n=1 Tax=Arctium lappa TaxID=4217 RepID=A0ACB8ZB91_ARCLA|nr:hypothetical protein L6452_33160 [Arctium lappa]
MISFFCKELFHTDLRILFVFAIIIICFCLHMFIYIHNQNVVKSYTDCRLVVAVYKEVIIVMKIQKQQRYTETEG